MQRLLLSQSPRYDTEIPFQLERGQILLHQLRTTLFARRHLQVLLPRRRRRHPSDVHTAGHQNRLLLPLRSRNLHSGHEGREQETLSEFAGVVGEVQK